MTPSPPPSPASRPPISPPDLLVALGITLAGVLLLFGTFQIPFGINAVVGPRVFPLIVSAGIIVLGLFLTFNALRGDYAEPGLEEDTDPNAPINHVNPTIILVGFLLGAVLLQPLGFVLGTAIMYFSVAYAFGERRYGLMLLVALTVSLVTYVMFTRGLGLTLPAGFLKGIL
ncbi:tripartite tricarboxylate transporter TctB family protein (plasmid) [Deinococcus wulumuqiensis]|uniref:Tripartite tricarboxylate transporter TctB family protein n=1 Tax=Deinococcus wulumuqiensis TaxID=980427 RepID=A0A345IM33_9DEIO|nr:tripartite tricarboxylate transporter TctB family protein [Deinococcus wulumuqiensis]AXH00756.1 tripartite tricarboxylate transporter TctB family protein [Deinococcus wulumuqiensis]